MKKICFLLFIIVNLSARAQNADHLVTHNGIGAIKVGMKQAALEKLLNKKFTLKNLKDPEGAWLDTIKTTYKNAPITLYLEKSYIDDNTYDVVLYGVESSNPLCKTRSGIGIGSDRSKIINDYEGFVIFIAPDFEDDTYTTRSKTKSTVTVSGEEENMIVFHLVNKKVVSIEVAISYGE